VVAAPVTGARDEILARIRSAIADASASEPTPHVPFREDVELTTLFVERVADYDVGVRFASTGELAGTVADVCRAHGAFRVAVPPGLPEAWTAAGVELVRDDGLAYDELDRLDGALTGSALAIAETGTIVLDHGPTQGRRALTLVPDLHICLVDEASIVARVPDAFERIRADGPVTFVFGPSATSDIELSRVRGVHGPRRLEVVIVQR
jgi:L-lactate dehydrogenase complex protein LldG